MSNLFNSVLVFCHSHSKLEGKLQVKPDGLLINPIKTSDVRRAALPVVNLPPVSNVVNVPTDTINYY